MTEEEAALLGKVVIERDHLKREMAIALGVISETSKLMREIQTELLKAGEVNRHMMLARQEAGCPDDDTLVMHCRQLREKLEAGKARVERASRLETEQRLLRNQKEQVLGETRAALAAILAYDLSLPAGLREQAERAMDAEERR